MILMANVTMCHPSHFMGKLYSCCEKQKPSPASTSQRLINAIMRFAIANAIAEVGFMIRLIRKKTKPQKMDRGLKFWI